VTMNDDSVAETDADAVVCGADRELTQGHNRRNSEVASRPSTCAADDRLSDFERSDGDAYRPNVSHNDECILDRD